MVDDSFYLEALLNNDVEVIKTIYKNNFFKIKSFVLSNKGQQQDAEDIFQNALMQLAVRYDKEKFVITSSFEAYLFTVCKNLWRRELNKTKIRVTKYETLQPEAKHEDIAASVLEQERWELFTEKLEEISGRCKELLKSYFSKMSYADIVKKFNYSSETVARQSVFKCKTRLKELVKKDKRFNLLKNL